MFKVNRIIKPTRKEFDLSLLGYPSRIVDEDLFRWFQRIHNQQKTIVRLATEETVVDGEFEDAVKVITEAAANVLNVERASIWLLDENNRKLRCVNLFELTPERHSNGSVFSVDEYPNYFRALENGRAVDARDACNDPRTSKFFNRYLSPLGIISVLNAAIRVSGKTVGIMCHEHVGKPRKWSSDEINFAGEIADQIAHLITNCKRTQVEKALQKAHDNLEKRVKERTRELLEEIAERRRAEAKEKLLQVQLLQTEKLSSIGLLAAGVAHELNSPLAGLLSLLRTFRKRSPHDSEDYQILTEMLESAEHMAKVVKDLNHFSKVSEDEHREIDLTDVIETTLSFSEHQLIHRNIKIVKNYTKNLPKVSGNKSQLQQVVLNILTNARDAMAAGGMLSITTRFDQGSETVNIEFSDTGQGIRAEHLSKIFDPFFTTKPQGKGTGLGLSVSHGIIQSHKGEFLVESQLGKGTTFVVKLSSNNLH
jgi:signal transduction histidine kinase